ncbi:MAG: pyridoxal-phosphate dependent enzyme [Desulfobacterales bacterium]|nr:MAG: pyridoxal-phosphate dependent enzyme [Desulfobacterales bacterium]
MMELKQMGWVEGKLPPLVAVQATGCAPIVKAFEEKRSDSEFWNGAKTCAFGITVPKALGNFLVLDAIYKTDGCAIAVTDDELLKASALMARTEGTFICPEGAANLSAAIKSRDSGWIKPEERVVLLNTGSGLKYPETVTVTPPVLLPGDKLPLRMRPLI